MLALLVQPVRQIVAAVLANDSPRQVAAAFTLGMMLGLLPKANLIAAVLGVLLCALRINKPAGLAAVGIFSCLGPMLDPIADQLGHWLLRMESLQSTYVMLYDMPLGPWIGFNNTVVLGMVVLGIYLTPPVFIGAIAFLKVFRPVLIRWVNQYRVGRLLVGADIAARVGG